MWDFDLLTVEQVSGRLLIGSDAVRRWLRDGRLTGYKLPGGDWRIKVEDVDAILRPVDDASMNRNPE